MADRGVTGTVSPARPAAPARARTAALPWWARALAVFTVSRVVTTALFLWVGTQATSASRAGAHPDLVALGTAWDGQWYWLVSESGYPATLPVGTSGAIATNQWAFLPLYPYLVKLLSLGVGPAWPPVALLTSTAFGFGSAVLLAMLLRRRLADRDTLFAVAVFSFAPLSFVLQTAYAESMGLFLLLAVLCLVDRARYLLAIPFVVALAFTRPMALPVALAVGVHLAVRFVAARRWGAPLPARELAAGGAFVAAAIAAGFAWAGIAALATGVPDAYFQTEQAWRALWMPGAAFAYFTPWLFAADFWFGGLGPLAGPLVLLALLVGFVTLLLTPAVRRLGALVTIWAGSYVLYLLTVFFPQSSLFRLLMPLTPLAGAVVPRPPAARVAVLVGCAALQGLWLWCVDGPFQMYWSVP
jgi:hypothetical protein